MARSKLIPLAEAVAAIVKDGDTVFIGGFGQCIPFAIAHETIRQQRRRLTLCRSGADIVFDMMIAAGCVSRVIVGYIGNPGIGLAHAYRRALDAGEIEVEHWTNFALVLRLHAAALGVPFLPTATLLGGGLPAALGVRPVTCPYSGEELSAVPALKPDVAFVHAHRADEDGNVQMAGLPGDTVEGALASDRIVVTVEEIVSRETLRRSPGSTVIPGFRVASVSEVPMGAWPSYVSGHYGRDDAEYQAWDTLSRDATALGEWIDRMVLRQAGFGATLRSLEPGRIEALRAEGVKILERLPA